MLMVNNNGARRGNMGRPSRLHSYTSIMPSVLRSIVFASALTQSACSFMFVVPEKRTAQTHIDCPSVVAPIVDTLVSVLGLGVFAFVAGDAIGSGRVGELLHGGERTHGRENLLVLPVHAFLTRCPLTT